jgi:hypothetical protein
MIVSFGCVVRKLCAWGVKMAHGVIAMGYPEVPNNSNLILSWLVGTNMERSL